MTKASLSSPSSGGTHVSSSEQDTQDLEMLENVAYGHLPAARYISS